MFAFISFADNGDPALFSGLSFEGSSLYIIMLYVGFIVVLFVVLKFTVSYLHNLFDTADPIPFPSPRPLKVDLLYEFKRNHHIAGDCLIDKAVQTLLLLESEMWKKF